MNVTTGCSARGEPSFLGCAELLLNFISTSRRICPGVVVAEREIWLTISRMLWAFNMYEIPGEPIDLNEYDGLSGRSPVPFRIRLEPRHPNVAKVLGME